MDNIKNIQIPKTWLNLASKAYSAVQRDDMDAVKEHLQDLRWRMRTNEDEDTKEKIEVDRTAWCQVMNSSYAIEAGDIGSTKAALEKANRYFPLSS